jgi:hypothetical protein
MNFFATYFKLIILVVIFGTIFQAQAQKHPVFYAGINIYRNGTFEDNTYGSYEIGAQVYQLKFFAPEIGFTQYWGGLQGDNIYRESPVNSTPHGVFEQQFSASLLTLNPKLKFGREDAFITFNPKYHIGLIKARGDYLVYQSNGNTALEERQKVENKTAFWSFAIGFEGFQITSKYWFGITLNYTTVSAMKVWDKLDFSQYGAKAISSHINTIGLGIRFYYNPFGSKND